MHHWISVLDKFDDILERKIAQYRVADAQVEKFEDSDKAMLLEILRVEKLIMDNATSRKIFASYDVRLIASHLRFPSHLFTEADYRSPVASLCSYVYQ
jgi:hypothetical protein